jgi:hypothetical protein
MVTEEMARDIVRRQMWAEYLKIISAPFADLEFEYLAYRDAIGDLNSGAFAPSAVFDAYVGFYR